MKAKTLLIAAAALAAGVISSQAQVYSQNIVGYVNSPTPAGFTAVANPLGNGNNSATNLFDTTSGANDGSVLYIWTGTKYSQVQFDSTQTTGFSDAVSGNPVTAPTLAPGTGFLFNNQNASNTVTYVGVVTIGGPGASTNVVGLTTNILSSHTLYSFPSSVLPIGGGISSVLGIVNVGGNLDGSLVLIPKITGGVVHGYTEFEFDSTQTTGFSDAVTGNAVAEPVISVGGSFLFSNQSGSDYQWVQSL